MPGTQLAPGHSWEAFCFSVLVSLPWFMSSTSFFRKHFETVNGRKCLYSAFMFNSYWAMYGIWVRNHFPSEFSRHCLLASSLAESFQYILIFYSLYEAYIFLIESSNCPYFSHKYSKVIHCARHS